MERLCPESRAASRKANSGKLLPGPAHFLGEAKRPDATGDGHGGATARDALPNVVPPPPPRSPPPRHAPPTPEHPRCQARYCTQLAHPTSHHRVTPRTGHPAEISTGHLRLLNFLPFPRFYCCCRVGLCDPRLTQLLGRRKDGKGLNTSTLPHPISQGTS